MYRCDLNWHSRLFASCRLHGASACFHQTSITSNAGVGALIKSATQHGRAARPELEVGVCGEHGGDPTSIAFFDAIPGIDYVSCSPLRIPVARLAAAQAALKRRRAAAPK